MSLALTSSSGSTLPPPDATALAYYDPPPTSIHKLQINALIRDEIAKKADENEQAMDDENLHDDLMSDQNSLHSLFAPYDKDSHPLLYELEQKLLRKQTDSSLDSETATTDEETVDPFTPEQRRRINLVYKALEYGNLSLLKEFHNAQYPQYLNKLQNVKDHLKRCLESTQTQSIQTNQDRKARNTSVGAQLDRLQDELKELKLEEHQVQQETHFLRQKLKAIQQQGTAA